MCPSSVLWREPSQFWVPIGANVEEETESKLSAHCAIGKIKAAYLNICSDLLKHNTLLILKPVWLFELYWTRYSVPVDKNGGIRC